MNPARLGWATWWGTLGFCALLVHAIVRLAPIAISAVRGGLTPVQWVICAGYCAFMLYSEGYKGFHRQASPRVVARGIYLAGHRRPLLRILAPLFCMGLFHATRKRLIISWALVVMIVSLIIAVRFLPPPWRGIVDAGVVLGLAVGVASTLYHLARAAAGHPPVANPDLPATS